jgi:anti-anti-sigma factor
VEYDRVPANRGAAALGDRSGRESATTMTIRVLCGMRGSVVGVTALRQLASPTGLRPGDHVFWTFDDPSEFSAAVLPYLDEGRRLSEQLLLIGASRVALLGALASLPERDEMLASGQLEVRLMAEIVDPARGLEPVEQVESYRGEVAAALGRGRTGLRVAADVTTLAQRGSVDRRQLHVYERLADGMTATVALTALCLYDSSLDDDVLLPLAVLHPDQHHGGREPLGCLCERGPWLSLRGEVDLSLADAVLRALVDVTRDAPGEVVLDLADLDFLDVAGARMLATAVRLLGEVGVHLRMVRARRPVGRCLELFDLADGQAICT